jgi:hypothetical protein
MTKASPVTRASLTSLVGPHAAVPDQ